MERTLYFRYKIERTVWEVRENYYVSRLINVKVILFVVLEKQGNLGVVMLEEVNGKRDGEVLYSIV